MLVPKTAKGEAPFISDSNKTAPSGRVLVNSPQNLHTMRLSLKSLTIVAILAAGAQAAITGVGKLSGTYVATANSTIAITFLTSITLNYV